MSNDTKPLVKNPLNAAVDALRQYQSMNSWWRIWPFSASKQVKDERLGNLKKAAQTLYDQEIKKINQQKNRDSIFKTAKDLMPFLPFVESPNNEETEINALILWIEFKNHRHAQYKPTFWDKITGKNRRIQAQHHQEMQQMISNLTTKTNDFFRKEENQNIDTIEKTALTFNRYDEHLTDEQRTILKNTLSVTEKEAITTSTTINWRSTSSEELIQVANHLKKENIFDVKYDRDTASLMLAQLNRVISNNPEKLYKKLKSDPQYSAAFTYLFLTCHQEELQAPKATDPNNTTISSFFEQITNPIAAMHILEELLKNEEQNDHLKQQLKKSTFPVVNKYNRRKVDESTSCWRWAKSISRETTLDSFPNVKTIYLEALERAKSSSYNPSEQPSAFNKQIDALREKRQRQRPQ